VGTEGRTFLDVAGEFAGKPMKARLRVVD